MPAVPAAVPSHRDRRHGLLDQRAFVPPPALAARPVDVHPDIRA
jgi:hypothetical protein